MPSSTRDGTVSTTDGSGMDCRGVGEPFSCPGATGSNWVKPSP